MSRSALNKLIAGLLLLTSLLVTACKRILLYEAEGGLYLELRVDQDFLGYQPCGLMDDPSFRAKAMGVTPEMVRVFVYDPDTHDKVHEDLLPPTGGFINVDPGVYDIIVYGMGTVKTRLASADNRGLLKAYTDIKGTLTVIGVPSSTIIDQPDQLYAGSASLVTVPMHPEIEGIEKVHLDLEPAMQTWTFAAYDITGLERVTSMECYITGQAPDRFLWDGHFTVNPVALEISPNMDPEECSVKAVFNTFGKIPEYSSKVVLNVQVGTSGGKYYNWSYDITDQFNNPDNNCHNIVVDNPVDIPDDKTDDGGGLDTGVNPWNPHVIDIFI
jgi:hypothetical protein